MKISRFRRQWDISKELKTKLPIKLEFYTNKTIFQNEKKKERETFSAKNSLSANMYILWGMLKEVFKQKENDGRGNSESMEKSDEC